MIGEKIAVITGAVLGIIIAVFILYALNNRKGHRKQMPVTHIDKLTTKELKNVVERKIKE